MEYKICSKPLCTHNGVPQPTTNFYHSSQCKDGYHPQCKDCVRIKDQIRAKAKRLDPAYREREATYHACRAYGILPEEVQRLRQIKICALCGGEADRSKGFWNHHIDHNHDTGKVRGVLCGTCNKFLSLVERLGLDRIARYLSL